MFDEIKKQAIRAFIKEHFSGTEVIAVLQAVCAVAQELCPLLSDMGAADVAPCKPCEEVKEVVAEDPKEEDKPAA